MVPQTALIVTFYVHCLTCFYLKLHSKSNTELIFPPRSHWDVEMLWVSLLVWRNGLEKPEWFSYAIYNLIFIYEPQTLELDHTSRYLLSHSHFPCRRFWLKPLSVAATWVANLFDRFKAYQDNTGMMWAWTLPLLCSLNCHYNIQHLYLTQ